MNCVQIWHNLAGERALRWNTLRERCATASPYHDPIWITLLAEQLGLAHHHLVVVGAEGLLAVLPGLVRRRPWKARGTLLALPLSHHVPLLAITPEAAREAEDALARQCALGLWDSISIHAPTLVPLRAGNAPQRPWLHVADRWISALDLARFHQQGERRYVHASALRNARKAEASGVTIIQRPIRQSVDDLYRLLVETRQRQGVPPYPSRFIAALGELPHARVFAASVKGLTQAILVFLIHKKEAIYLYGASSRQAYTLRANDFLFLTALRVLASEGYTRCDFGTSPRWHSELVRFKEKWGCSTLPWGSTIWRAKGDAPSADIRNSCLGRAISACIRHTPRPILSCLSDSFFRFLV